MQKEDVQRRQENVLTQKDLTHLPQGHGVVMLKAGNLKQPQTIRTQKDITHERKAIRPTPKVLPQ